MFKLSPISQITHESVRGILNIQVYVKRTGSQKNPGITRDKYLVEAAGIEPASASSLP
jgi:hypothetical protein